MFENQLDKIKERAKNPTTGADSERAEIVGRFLNRLNEDRQGKFRKLRASSVASLLGYIKTNDELRLLYDQCNNARKFGSMFWYYVKGKKARKHAEDPELGF